MNRDSNKQSAIILAVIGILPVVWLGLLIAPSVKGGLPEILPSLLTVFNDPCHIEPVSYTHLDVYKRQVLCHFAKSSGQGLQSRKSALSFGRVSAEEREQR